MASHSRGTVATVGGDSSITVALYTTNNPALAWIEITDVIYAYADQFQPIA